MQGDSHVADTHGGDGRRAGGGGGEGFKGVAHKNREADTCALCISLSFSSFFAAAARLYSLLDYIPVSRADGLLAEKVVKEARGEG